MTGPDQSSLHQSCDQGFSLPIGNGFGTHAGRGTPETSCLFANSVLTVYWAEYGNASPLPRAVSAPGAVDCKAVPGALCNGSNFLMHCQQHPGDSWITCIGGQQRARVPVVSPVGEPVEIGYPLTRTDGLTMGLKHR